MQIQKSSSRKDLISEPSVFIHLRHEDKRTLQETQRKYPRHLKRDDYKKIANSLVINTS